MSTEALLLLDVCFILQLHKDVSFSQFECPCLDPLGSTGARLTTALLHEMRRRGSRYGVVSMCVGTGMGAAAVFERC